jgi:glucose/arabinose dehydrogenase
MQIVIQISDHRRPGLMRLMCGLLGLTMLFGSALAQPAISLIPVVPDGLSLPMQLTHAGDGTGRIFVAERAGVIKVFDGNSATPTVNTFLNLNSPTVKVGVLGEGGLLSIAFHPDYASATSTNRGVLFAFYTNTRASSGDLVIERYKVSNPLSNAAAVSEAAVVLLIPHRQNSNHNGGEMHFGKDGFLYVSTGDGGGAGDPNNNAQRVQPVNDTDQSHLLGKMLRINVNNYTAANPYTIPAGNPFNNEIFDYGLRNPFRWSFDRETGDMWIGDVGQNTWEEIDFRAATTNPGVNYGWNCFEGIATYTPISNPACGTFLNFLPAFQYTGASVIGGVVYRGRRYLDLIGYYVGTDHFSGEFQLIKRDDESEAWNTTVLPPATTGNPPQNITRVSDIGEAENGELYAVRLSTGSVFRIEASGALPVTLTKFHGRKAIEGNKLFWETTREDNFELFEVEYSKDMSSFEKIGTVRSHRDANGSKYEFSHTGGTSKQAYYRLKMMDLDKRFRYSSIVSIQDGEPANNFVRPSLISSGALHLILSEKYQTMEVISITGSVLHRQDISGKIGNLEIPIDGVPTGMYLIRLRNAQQVVQQKVLVMQ